MGKKTFLVDVAWMVGKQVMVEADSVEDAKKLALQSTLNGGSYIEDSFVVDNIEQVEEKVAFDEQLRAAIQKYGDNHVDIIIDGKKVHGVYHSRHDSFGVTDTYELNGLGGIEELKKYEKEFEELCVCEN